MRRGLGASGLRDLRRARRRRAYGDLDWADALYKVYVTAIFGAIGVSVASGYVGGDPVTAAELASATERGPAFIGLIVAVAAAAGLRSGGRGGPLALQPADVQLVLLAPIPRVRRCAGRRPTICGSAAWPAASPAWWPATWPPSGCRARTARGCSGEGSPGWSLGWCGPARR